LEADPDLHAVRECAREVREVVEAEEDLEEMRSGIYKGEPMETNIDAGPRGIQTEWSDVMATSVEEDVNCDKLI